VTKIFWDTNLFIYLVEANPKFGPAVKDLRRRMLHRHDQLFTSTMTVGEVLVKPVASGNRALAARYRELLALPQVSVATFDLAAAEAYAIIRNDRTIQPGDAIQLACAAAAEIDLFITNDGRLNRKNVPGIKFISSLQDAPI
jgi:predicted nucleic acid-binding protein